jgi:hypothetical protein
VPVKGRLNRIVPSAIFDLVTHQAHLACTGILPALIETFDQ